jgi:hypothetical protein
LRHYRHIRSKTAQNLLDSACAIMYHVGMKKKQVTFLIDAEDYEKLKEVGKSLALNIGALLRFALREFLKNRG